MDVAVGGATAKTRFSISVSHLHVEACQRTLKTPSKSGDEMGRYSETSVIWFGDEAIAESSDCQQMTWLRRAFFNVLSEAHNEVVDRASICVLPKAPHVFEQRFACHDSSLVPDQMAQELRFHQRQPDGSRAGPQFQSRKIDRFPGKEKIFEEFILDWAGRLGSFRCATVAVVAIEPFVSPEQTAKPSDQDRELERFCQVVICSRFEAAQHVLRLIARRQHQQRHELSRLPQFGRN